MELPPLPSFGGKQKVDINQLAEAIGKRESSGNYGAIGPATSKGQRAYGKYQVMDFNIPSWTKEVLGRSLTPQQFLKDTKAQDAVARAKLGSYVAKYGTAEDAASMWFSGRPVAKAGNAKDVLGTSVPQYVKDVTNFLASGKKPLASLDVFSNHSASTPSIGTLSGPSLLERAIAGPRERIGSVIDSFKQGSLEPLKKSFAAQFNESKQKVNLATGEPQNMDYADPRKQAMFAPQGLQTAIASIGGGHGTKAVIPKTPVESAVTKLITAVKNAKPIRAQANKLASVERGVRAAKGAGALKSGSGESSFYSALGQLKGELPKPQFEGVRLPKDMEQLAKDPEALAQKVSDLETEIGLRRDALENSMANGLRKYYGSNDPRFESLDEIYTRNVGKSKAGTLDAIVQEHGFNSVEDAHQAVLQDLDLKDSIVQLERELSSTKSLSKSATSKLTQEDVDHLFNAVKEYPMDFYSQINAMSGLSKVLGDGGGQIPTPGELKLLGRIFGNELPQEIFSKRSLGTKVWDTAKDILNIPRTLMSSIDMSAPFRQGAVLFANNPKQGAQAFKDMFKYFGNPKYFDASMEDIQRRPSFPLMRESGLAITDTSGGNFALSAKEEAFMSNLAGKIPVVGRLVGASERAYTGFLNKIRADVFDDISKQYIAGGIDPKAQPEVFERLADFVNTASGRGDLGPLNSSAPLLNGAFFSPRFMASRLQMLNPYWYFKQPPQIRKLAALSAVKFVSTGLGILALAKAGGASVEADPRSADFGQIKLGNFRWDVWAGFRPWVNFIAREINGQSKNTTTGNLRTINRLNTAGSFLRSKLGPLPGLAVDILDNKTILGAPIDLNKELVDKVTPLYVQDVMEAVKQGGLTGGISVGVPAFFGIGTNAYSPQKPKGKLGGASLPPLPQLPKLPSLGL